MSWQTAITANNRQIKAKVEVYRASTKVYTFNYNDYLQDIEIDRQAPDNTIAGFVSSAYVKVNVIDKNHSFTPNIGDLAKVYIGVMDGNTLIYKHITDFIISSTTRQETGYILTIEGNDPLYVANNKLFEDMTVTYPITLNNLFGSVCSFCGYSSSVSGVASNLTSISIPTPASGQKVFATGTTCREVLRQIMELWGAGLVYYIDPDDGSNTKTYKAVAMKTKSSADYSIDKTLLFSESTESALTVGQVVITNDLNDTISVGSSGSQYVIRNNDILVSRSDVTTIATNIYNQINGYTLYPFNIKWRGNPLVAAGDKITLATKNSSVATYYYGDTIKYNGGMSATAAVSFGSDEIKETADASLGDKIKQTYAKVDKANNRIELVAGGLATLALDVEGLHTTVSTVDGKADTAITQSGNAVTISANAVETAEDASETAAAASSTASTAYTQSSNAITLAASKYGDGDGDKIVSQINLQPGTVTIDAKNINLNGVTTFVKPSDIYTSGTTTIDGGKITSGSITADEIHAGTITANKINGVNASTIISASGSNEVSKFYVSDELGVEHMVITSGGSYIRQTEINAFGVSTFDQTGAEESADWFEIIEAAQGGGGGSYTAGTGLVLSSNEFSIRGASSATNGYVLTRDSSATGGVKWAAASAEPSAYIKSASVSSGVLTLTKKDNTTVTYQAVFG